MTRFQLKARKGSYASLDSDARSDTRREHHQEQRKTKSHLVKLLFEAGCAESAKKVAECNAEYFTLACRNGHCARTVPSSRCRSRLCPFCAASRQRRALLRLYPIVKSYADSEGIPLVLVTLTLKTQSHLAIADKEFKAAFHRLRRLKRWKDHIAGALCSYEFTLTASGWNYHAHILCFRRTWYDQADLAEDWRRAARTSIAIADIRAISNLSDGLRSTVQYCFKPIPIDNWTASEVKQFADMNRLKLSDCFGSLRGLRAVEDFAEVSALNQPLFVGCPCPECGEPLRKIKISWRELDSLTVISNDSSVKTRAGPLPKFPVRFRF